MRLFIAIPLVSEVRTQVTDTQDRLRQTGADVRWVEPANFHLTVKFLGDLSDALLPDIKAACETIAAETAPFRIRVHGASYFPKHKPTIKTLLLNITEGAETWKALVRKSESWFVPMGVPQGDGLAPHVTLGRVRSDRGMSELRMALTQEAETDCGAQEANEIVLVQSTLDPKGAIYQDVQRWEFGLSHERPVVPE